jgi:hypothetical protein
VISRDHVSLHTAAALRAVAGRAGFERPRVFSRNVLPHEIAKAFRRKPAAASPTPAGEPSPMAKTVALQARIESRPHLRLIKGAVNSVLRATGLGDTLVLRATRPASVAKS